MPESAARPSPYDVLGVTRDAGIEELRRAYRRRLRETHPDTGGDAVRFQAVQNAWARIGDPGARAAFDRGQPSDPSPAARPHEGPTHRRADAAPKARSYGHPGGWAREQFLVLMREWADRGELPDPYDEALVRAAPREIRRLLAEALAEESTARTVAALGLGYTIWNDVRSAGGKLDHVVLGPSGLVALDSEDWGGPVKIVKGELVGPDVARDERPFDTLERDSRVVARPLGVRFTTLAIVVPDDDLAEPLTVVAPAKGRRPAKVVLRRSLLPSVLASGVPGSPRSVADVFEVRSRLQNGLRFL